MENPFKHIFNKREIDSEAIKSRLPELDPERPDKLAELKKQRAELREWMARDRSPLDAPKLEAIEKQIAELEGGNVEN